MKVWTIALNDTLIRFRDRNAILLMLLAPLVISLIIGTAFGGFFTGSSAPLSDIPLLLVNEDQGALGEQFVALFEEEEELEALLAVTLVDDLEAAREQVAAGEARAAIYLPPGFSDSIGAAFDRADAGSVTIELYTDPVAAITPNIIRSIVEQIAMGYNSAAVSSNLLQQAVPELLGTMQGPPPADLEERLVEIGTPGDSGQQARVDVLLVTAEQESEAIDPMAYFAPSMAIFFLMFTMFEGTSSILDEEQDGTLARMMSTPTSLTEILLGKIGGTFLTGLLQFAILVLATRLFFQLSWGRSPLGLILMALAVVAAATSLGAFVASITRDIRQANVVGSTVVLVSALIGGAFFTPYGFPDWLQTISRLSINRWGLDGFVDLTMRGAGVTGILLEAGVLLGTSLLLFLIALLRFRARFTR